MATFAAVGAINTLLDFTLFYLLLSRGPLTANMISTVVATTSSYLMTRYWTYRDRLGVRAIHREFLLFAFVNLVGLVIQQVVLAVARYGLDFHEQGHSLALLQFKLVGVAAAVIFRFWALRRLVFPVGTGGPGAEPLDALLPDNQRTGVSESLDATLTPVDSVAGPADRELALARN